MAGYDDAAIRRLLRLRSLRRDMRAARLTAARRTFAPVDAEVARIEAMQAEAAERRAAINAALAEKQTISYRAITERIEEVEQNTSLQLSLRMEADNAHERRIEALAELRRARAEWNEANRAYRRLEELGSLIAGLESTSRRITEENSTQDSVFFVNQGRPNRFG
jgi:hypothetical protein